MWYEALPSLVLTTFFVALPYGALPFIHMFVNNGNPYSRLQNDTHHKYLYRRDLRLSGAAQNPYVLKGLESIPD